MQGGRRATLAFEPHEALGEFGIKHSHKAIEIDRPGKDSYHLREAGCSEVLLLGNDRRALMHELRGLDEPALGKPTLWPHWPGIVGVASDGPPLLRELPQEALPPAWLDLADTCALAAFVGVQAVEA